VAALLVLLAGITLRAKLWRLVGDPGPRGAIDIKILYAFTQSWFRHIPIYDRPPTSGVTYPPASFLILWPAYGWLTLQHARAWWAVIQLAALSGLGVLFARAIRTAGPVARFIAVLAPFTMPALADAFGIGQLTIAVLWLVLASVLIAVRGTASWPRDLAAAILFDLALVKPSLSAPFFILLLIVPARIRPAALAVAGYGLLTLVSSAFQPVGIVEQIEGWLIQAKGNSGMGYGNIQDALHALGWSGAFPVLGVLLLVALAAFVWRCRRADIWLLLGVSAVAARLWTYHRVYDDGVLIVGLAAVARLMIDPGRARSVRLWQSVVFTSAVLVLWIPIVFHYPYSTLGPLVITPAWVWLFNVSHVAAFLLVLVELVRAGLSEERPLATPTAQNSV
jgi:hypothetical protein